MTRIFLTLATLANVLLATAFVLGLMIGDPRVADPHVQAGVSAHFLTAVGALVFGSFAPRTTQGFAAPLLHRMLDALAAGQKSPVAGSR